jgi:uncharacterized protein YhaN
MRLRRIEAVRFGALTNAALGDLGDALTVVLGPNEAGKSTFAALVRTILYGFPTASKDGAYLSGAGKREGRLIFEEGSGRWALERSEGPHGGPWIVRALNGAERPLLRDEVTSGVSEEAFRVVFGFGLDDMARIETLRGSGDDIIAPLYAASVGLTVSPQEVRARIGREAEELFAPRARTKRVHELLGQLRSTRGSLREVRDSGAAFAAERTRLRELEESTAAATAERDALRATATDIEASCTAYEERIAQINERGLELADLRRQRATALEALERTTPDEHVLAVAADIDALAEQASAFAQIQEEARTHEAAAAGAERRCAEACADLGWDAERVLAADTGPSVAAAIESARDEVQRLEAEREGRVREADRSAASAERARAVAETALAQVGLDLTDDTEAALDDVAAQLDARDARAGGAPARRVDVPALVLLIAGLLTLATGLALAEYVSAVIGGVLALAGGVLLARALRAKPAAAPALGAEAFRARRAIEAARSALGAYRGAAGEAAEASQDAALVAGALETRYALLAAALSAAGLDADLTPAAAAQLLAALKDARRINSEVREAAEHAAAARERLDAYAARLGEAVTGFMDAPLVVTHDAFAPLLGRAREALAQAREAREQRVRLVGALADIDERVASAEERVARLRQDALAVLLRYDLEEGGSATVLEARATHARRLATEAERSHDMLAVETARLAGALDTLASEDRGATLRLEEASVKERLGDAVDRYAVLAVADRLLAAAQERYERERQPDVVKRAETVFRAITRDRYVGLGMPLGEGRIEVFDSRSSARTSAELSRGTAEALYLALRLGLIAHLGDVGPGLPLLMDDVLVNFDTERRVGVAAAVAELAQERQVVVFTCHPEIADLFATAAPDRTLIELDRC